MALSSCSSPQISGASRDFQEQTSPNTGNVSPKRRCSHRPLPIFAYLFCSHFLSVAVGSCCIAVFYSGRLRHYSVCRVQLLLPHFHTLLVTPTRGRSGPSAALLPHLRSLSPML